MVSFLISSLYASLFLFGAFSAAQSSSSTPSHSASGSGTSTSTSKPPSSSASTTSTAAWPSLSGYSTCVVDCLNNAIAGTSCDSVVDVNCYCAKGRQDFENWLFTCVSSQCSVDLQGAESLAQQFCNLASTSASLSFPSTSFATSSASAPSSVSTANSSSSASVTTPTSPSQFSSTTLTTSSSSAPSSASGAAPAHAGGAGPMLMALAVGAVVLVGGALCV